MTTHRTIRLLCILLLGMGLASSAPICAHPSHGIVIDKGGTIYFSDVIHNGRGTLWALQPDGRLDTLVRDFHAHNVVLDENGILYSAHGEDVHTLISFLPQGEQDTLVATADEERFNSVNWALSPSGDIYFGLNNQVWTYTDSITQPVCDLRLERNQSMYVDAAGRIYATEIGSYNGDLWRIDPYDSTYRVIASDLITTFPGRKRRMNDDVLLGISGDAYGNIYVAETAGRRIVRIDSTGCVSTFYRGSKPWYPTGIAFHNDVAYVLEYGYDSTWIGPRIVKMDLDGDRQVVLEIDAAPTPPTEEKMYIMPFVAVGIIALVGLAMWLTFRSTPVKETKTAEANVADDQDEVSLDPPQEL